MGNRRRVVLASFCLFSLGLAVYSYSQVDLNLTLMQQATYLKFQEVMTRLGYYQRLNSSVIFLALSGGLIGGYLLLMREAIGRNLSGWQWWPWLGIAAGVLVLGYPAFSHDVFNYLFNAKMVWAYQANPHIQVAADFPQDLWLRFMHNVHTPAPYAYGWTGLSLLPGLATITNNLKLSLLAMKLFIGLFWVGQLWALAKLVERYFPKERWRWFLFAFNPLVLVETLVVGHNDVVMMFWALLSYWLLKKSKRLLSKEFLGSLVFLGFSISIKYATVVLLPLWLGYATVKWFKPFYRLNQSTFFDPPAGAAVLLSIVMFTRPDQLHSWYLIWAFSLAVLAKSRWLVVGFTAATLGALLRYAPYLYLGTWDPPVPGWRNLFWLGVTGLGLLAFNLRHGLSKK